MRHRPGSEQTGPFSADVVSLRAMSIEQAKAGDEHAFAALVEPHRHELQLHCYRMLGSLQDAEDLVQETLLAAWRSLGGFEERASLRAWLYRIATNRSLNALRERGRRPAVEEKTMAPPPTRYVVPSWLEPYPDSALPDPTPGPEARYEQREATQLAFVAGLQQLPERQRAALVLRDVLGFNTEEVATMLDATPQSIKAALQRARATLDQRVPKHERAPLPDSPAEREIVALFSAAIEAGDTARVVALLTDQARLTMPPLPLEYTGHAAIAEFLDYRTEVRGAPLELRPTRANCQPAFGCYLYSRAWGMLALTLSGEQIAEITLFSDPSLVSRFGLPRQIR
jgi:RNA polymerase sigma-70 factor (TIGR02960 family)